MIHLSDYMLLQFQQSLGGTLQQGDILAECEADEALADFLMFFAVELEKVIDVSSGECASF